MSVEYNSMLISKLYSATIKNDEEVENTLTEMENIGDPIFLYPIYEMYKKFIESAYSHYFISALGELKTNESIPIILEITENSGAHISDHIFALEALNKKKYFESRGVDIASKILLNFIHSSDTNEYHLYIVVSYLINAGLLSKIENDLFCIFNTTVFNRKTREYAFEKLLEIDAKKYLQSAIDNYEEIKKDSIKESVVARGIIGWKGPKIEILKKMISDHGGVEAKHILEKVRLKDVAATQKAAIEKQDTLNKQYTNVELVAEIFSIREKINGVARLNQKIGISFFPQNEALFNHVKIAYDSSSLVAACINLRDIISSIDVQVKNDLSTEQIHEVFPEMEEPHFNRAINRLVLFLYERGFSVDFSCFGLRSLNQLLNLLGGHAQLAKDDLLKKIKEENLVKSYIEDDWGSLHQEILGRYLKFLKLLLQSLVV
jgi:hypothetical protein